MFLGFALTGHFDHPPEEQPNTPIGLVVPPSSQVHGAAASLFLAKQAEKNRKVTEALQAASAAKDFDLALRLLRARDGELRSALAEVEKSEYDTADKAVIQRVIEQELQWADDGINSLVQARSGR